MTDYQFDKNTHTDSHFLQESLSAMEKSEEEIILVTDGGYDGQDNVAVAKEKNVRLISMPTSDFAHNSPSPFEIQRAF